MVGGDATGAHYEACHAPHPILSRPPPRWVREILKPLEVAFPLLTK